ncbi:MAG: TolC family protein [Planctomycetota bacterium]
MNQYRQSVWACRSRLALLWLGLLTVGCALPPGREAMREQAATGDLAAYRARAPEVPSPVTLADALRLADTWNIEVWIAAQERKVQEELRTQSLLKLLPSLVAGVESRHRSELDAASSVSLDRGEQSLEPSYSSDKTTRTWDLSATWNLLDFGLSMCRARQQSNRVAIAAERERRIRQNLAFEVTRAYWQAVTTAVVAAEAERIGHAVDAALTRLAEETGNKTIAPADGLKRETILLEHLEELQRYRRLHLQAKTELATLMGLPPGTRIELDTPDLDAPSALPSLSGRGWGRGTPSDGLEDGDTPQAAGPEADLAALETEALRQRPELFEKDREEWISRDEAYIALAQMFPSFAVFGRYDWDHNRYLAFNEWSTVGLRASWDLLAIPSLLAQHGAARLQTELVKRQRTATAVAILTQVRLAWLDVQESADQTRLTRAIADRHRQLRDVVQGTAEQGKSHAGEALEQELKYLKALARYLTARANLMTAQARLENAVGRDTAVVAAGSSS